MKEKYGLSSSELAVIKSKLVHCEDRRSARKFHLQLDDGPYHESFKSFHNEWQSRRASIMRTAGACLDACPENSEVNSSQLHADLQYSWLHIVALHGLVRQR